MNSKAVKLVINDELRRVALAREGRYSQLTDFVKGVLSPAQNEFKLEYVDVNGEIIQIVDESSLENVLVKAEGQAKTLRLHVVLPAAGLRSAAALIRQPSIEHKATPPAVTVAGVTAGVAALALDGASATGADEIQPMDIEAKELAALRRDLDEAVGPPDRPLIAQEAPQQPVPSGSPFDDILFKHHNRDLIAFEDYYLVQLRELHAQRSKLALAEQEALRRLREEPLDQIEGKKATDEDTCRAEYQREREKQEKRFQRRINTLRKRYEAYLIKHSASSFLAPLTIHLALAGRPFSFEVVVNSSDSLCDMREVLADKMRDLGNPIVEHNPIVRYALQNPHRTAVLPSSHSASGLSAMRHQLQLPSPAAASSSSASSSSSAASPSLSSSGSISSLGSISSSPGGKGEKELKATTAVGATSTAASIFGFLSGLPKKLGLIEEKEPMPQMRVMTPADEERSLAELKVQNGSTIFLLGGVRLAGDNVACVGADHAHFLPRPQLCGCDHYACITCDRKNICCVCAVHCHAGHKLTLLPDEVNNAITAKDLNPKTGGRITSARCECPLSKPLPAKHSLHVHPLSRSDDSRVWSCDGCKARNPQIRYRCTEGCDFDICYGCWSKEHKTDTVVRLCTLPTREQAAEAEKQRKSSKAPLAAPLQQPGVLVGEGKRGSLVSEDPLPVTPSAPPLSPALGPQTPSSAVASSPQLLPAAAPSAIPAVSSPAPDNAPPKNYDRELRFFEDMGFTNRAMVEEWLHKHDGNLDLVLQKLLTDVAASAKAASQAVFAV